MMNTLHLFSDVEVYLPEVERGGRPVYYKLIEVCPRSANCFQHERTRISIVQHWEEKLRKRLNGNLNAVILKGPRGKIVYAPMEIVTLSDRPQKIAVGAIRILKELNRQLKEVGYKYTTFSFIVLILVWCNCSRTTMGIHSRYCWKA